MIMLSFRGGNPLDRKSPPGIDPSLLNKPIFGSDLIASALREQEIPYVCLNPGASYRGLHDSIVNFLGNATPEMALVLHEEHAVSIAHGYARIAERPLAVIVHSNVGLMHASMSIFNAWCDRLPMIILGATGPVDAAIRRPYIDWIHTAADQGALVRNYTKWDDQPGSPAAAVEAIRRGVQIAMTPPCGPVYINLDAAVQEMPLEAWPELEDVSRFAPPPPPGAPEDAVEAAAELLRAAESPLILAGRSSRSRADWDKRIELAEAAGARVLTSSWTPSAFPTEHPLHVATTNFFPTPAAREAHEAADVVLSLDWNDLGGTLRNVWGEDVRPKVISASMDFHVHRGWSMDYQALPAVDIGIPTTPEVAVDALLPRVRSAGKARPPAIEKPPLADIPGSGPIGIREFASVWRSVADGRKLSVTTLPIGWPPDAIHADHPLAYMGNIGGGGLGAGPGVAIGAALALKEMGSDRLPVSIMGDGDYLMGVNALWTAAHMEIPVLIIVDNNRSYFNDEMHQENVAKKRERPPENRWIGQRIDDPPPDLAALARAQGLEGDGPIEDIADLAAAIERGLEAVRSGKPYVLDVVALGEYVTTPVHGGRKSD